MEEYPLIYMYVAVRIYVHVVLQSLDEELF